MKTAAIAVSLLQARSRSCLPERVADFVSLMKARVMLLAVFTAVVGLAIMRHSFPKERI
jgi:heme O synthase-like polyprenyltransferase